MCLACAVEGRGGGGEGFVLFALSKFFKRGNFHMPLELHIDFLDCNKTRTILRDRFFPIMYPIFALRLGWYWGQGWKGGGGVGWVGSGWTDIVLCGGVQRKRDILVSHFQASFCKKNFQN